VSLGKYIVSANYCQ